jgi:hypothetical protein
MKITIFQDTTLPIFVDTRRYGFGENFWLHLQSIRVKMAMWEIKAQIKGKGNGALNRPMGDGGERRVH